MFFLLLYASSASPRLWRTWLVVTTAPSETARIRFGVITLVLPASASFATPLYPSLLQVVQFVYGSDGLDPISMEAKYQKTRAKQPTGVEANRPIDFHQVFEQIVVGGCCCWWWLLLLWLVLLWLMLLWLLL